MAEWGVGTQLRALRLDRGLTLEQLAESSGVSVRGISDIERGVRDRPRRSTIDALCDALKLDAGTRRELAREQARRVRTEAPAESVQPHRVQDFVGRDAEFRTISEHLGGGSHDGVPRTVIVAGPPGVGKTALAIEATQRLREPGSLLLFLDLLGPNPALARPALSVLQALYKGQALNSLGDHEYAITTLNESALAFDRVAYAAGAAQARSIASEAMRAGPSKPTSR